MACVEVEFLLSCESLKSFLANDQLQPLKTSMAKLKALASTGLQDDEEDEALLEYSLDHLGKTVKMYSLSLTR